MCGAAIAAVGFLVKKQRETESFLKKSLTRYEAYEDMFRPADFETDQIITDAPDIDRYKAVERPLLYLVRLIHNTFNAYTTALFDHYNNCLTLIKGFSSSELFQPRTVIELKTGLYRQIIASGKPLLIQEFVQNPEELGYYRGEVKIASVMVAPIYVLNRCEGLLVLDRKEEPFTEDDKVLFNEAVKSIALVLALIRRYTEKHTEAQHLRQLSDQVAELQRELDMEKILSQSAKSFAKILECADVSIASVDELNEVGEILYSTYLREHEKFSFDDGLVGIIARHKNYLIKEDLRQGELVVVKKSLRTHNLSFIGVPVFQDSDLLGVVWLEDHKKNKFTVETVNPLKILASQLSFAWQRAKLHQDVKELSERDGLTTLYNHRSFQEKLEQEISKKREVVLLFLDIDHFKKVNDIHGHQAGDRVLEFLGRHISQTGIAARYGGEEFAIILPKCSLKKGIDQAIRIKDHLLKSEIRVGQARIKITVSIGVAHYPGDAENRERLIEKADRALYRAKETGRDKIIVAKTMA
jgi:diguanylate cyclase (GGDEF)-like protein